MAEDINNNDIVEEQQVDEVIESEETVEQPEVSEEPTHDEKKEENVPLRVLIEERKKRQAIERELRKYQEAKTKDEIKSKLSQRYSDPEFVEEQAELQYNMRILQEKVMSKEADTTIKELAQTDDFYSDAVQYKDEIKSIMFEKHIDAEDAYMLLRGKARARELKEDMEQKAIIKRRGAEPKASPSNSTPSSPKNPYPLDDNDKKALQMLQQVQPEKKWTVEKYFKLMKQNN